jgi:hypothetical protein
MEFLIADTFTDSLIKLTGEEQKAVKTTAFDLQMNPVNSGMSFHAHKSGRPAATLPMQHHEFTLSSSVKLVRFE